MTESQRPWLGDPAPQPEGSSVCAQQAPARLGFPGALPQRRVVDYRDIEWFALEMNRDHSVVFETASKYCILESLVDHDGYSISSEGFLPTVVDIMVI